MFNKKLPVDLFLFLTLRGDKDKKKLDFDKGDLDYYYLFHKKEKLNLPMVVPGMHLTVNFFLNYVKVYQVIAVVGDPNKTIRVYLKDEDRREAFLGMANDKKRKEYLHKGWTLAAFNADLDEFCEYDKSRSPYEIIKLLQSE